MKIFVAGATGFIGQALTAHLHGEGHRVAALVRNPAKVGGMNADIEIVEGDPTRPGEWQQQAAAAEVLINLTGASILTRWSESAKRKIIDSRVLSTRNVVAAMGGQGEPPQTLINVSAAGYYGFTEGEMEKSEEDPPGDDFLAQVCVAWEREAQSAAAKGARVVIARLPVVLGPGGGALSKMLPAFRLGLGGRLGDGRQGFPWVHIADLIAIFSFLIAHPEISGPVNCGAPQSLSNAEFTKALGSALNRPTFLPVPTALLDLVMGEAAAMLLKGTRFQPAVLTDRGFSFQFPEINPALADILRK